MPLLDAASALAHTGSLLSPNDEIVAPYDLEVSNASSTGYRSLSSVADIKNANAAPFTVDYSQVTRVHIINGMGVTLGDSIIGLTALMAIKRRHPQIEWTIYRPGLAPAHVSDLYKLATPIFGSMINLPFKLNLLPADELQIDLGNHLFWPNFSSMPMIDFFLWALGATPNDFDANQKSNSWLRQLSTPPLDAEYRCNEYSLLCPTASTPVRSMPAFFQKQAVSALWEKYRLPVLGFGSIDHSQYRDISDVCKDTPAFVTWIKNARALLTTDTSAVHIAAGFGVPTLGIFTTISSALRVRDYRNCTAIDLPLSSIQGVHASSFKSDLEAVRDAYRELSTESLALKLPG